MLTVKLAQIPGATQEYVLDEGSTVATLLEIAGKDASNYAIRVNNSGADTSTQLFDGAIVVLAKAAVGNAA